MKRISWAIKVPKEKAEDVHKILLKRKIIDRNLKTLSDDRFVYFPVITPTKIEGFELLKMEFPQRPTINPKVRLLEELKKRVPENIISQIPLYWEILGDAIIIKLPEYLDSYKEVIGESFAKALNKRSVYVERGVSGEYRVPKMELVWGPGGPVIHKENGVLYKLDPAKVMFSSGNIDERIRMSKISSKREVVVDMFAGIGYFTLQIAVHSKPRILYAAEKNPIAYSFLIENIRINRVEDIVIPLLGDNRNVLPEGVADRVVMGYLHGTEKFLEKAFMILKPNGGFVHYHDLVHNDLGIKEARDRVLRVAEHHGVEIAIMNSRYVKSYSPNIWHIVLDLRVCIK